MFRASSHRWSELPKGEQWTKGGKENNRVSNTWVLGFSYKPRNHPAGAVSMDIASPSQRCAVGKEKSGQEGMYRNSFMQLLASICIHQSHIQMTLTISHAEVNCYLAGVENRILSCKASIRWKSKCQLTKYLDGEISHPLPILPPLWKVMGVGDNWRRNEIMRVHQEKIVLVASELVSVLWALPLDEASKKAPAQVLVALRTSILASIANRLSNQMLSGWDKRVRKQTCCTLLSTVSLWSEKAGCVVFSRAPLRSEAD